MRQLATAALMLLTIAVSAVYLPKLYAKVFFDEVEKTHLFYSPVTERFIYKEKIVGPLPFEALAKAEDHHAETAYRDQDGGWYTRVEFEKNLPFIYYKNMELWGLLPLELGGRTLDKKTIQDHRQVLELRSGDITGHKPQIELWPLLESNPGQVRLVFPEDRFRMTDTAMQFVNADTNTVDRSLTEKFTNSLKARGFSFPARSVHGKFTVLKPFDEGVFLVDANYAVFHVKRVDGEPRVIKTPIPQSLETRHIKVSENKRRAYYGLLLDGSGGVHLLSYGNYRLIRLPMGRYDPETMDFKLLLNPLYATSVYSDDTTIRAVVMDADFNPIDTYTHTMSKSTITPAKQFYAAIFPFTIGLDKQDGGFMGLDMALGGPLALAGLALGLAVYALASLARRRRPKPVAALVVAATGIYGLLAILALDEK